MAEQADTLQILHDATISTLSLGQRWFVVQMQSVPGEQPYTLACAEVADVWACGEARATDRCDVGRDELGHEAGTEHVAPVRPIATISGGTALSVGLTGLVMRGTGRRDKARAVGGRTGPYQDSRHG